MATRWDNLPGLRDDVVARDREDTAKAKKGREVDSSKLTGGAKDAVREAGQRASNRKIGRRADALGALGAGYMVGREIDKATGIGKKIVDKGGLGDIVDKVVSRRDKVAEPSKKDKERLQDEELAQMRRDIDADEKARREYSGRYADGTRLPDEEPYKGDGMKKGGRVKKMASGGMTASKRADGIASRGKTKCKMY
jgi:hypothetical protein